MKKKFKLRIILAAGLAAAALDIAAAIVVYSYILKLTSPQGILQSVAAGVYGSKAFSGGGMMAFTGLLLHIWIAIIFAAIFVWAYPLFLKLTRNAWVMGIVYGILVWSVMNLIVLPLSHANTPAFQLNYFVLSLTIIICCVGIPIAIISHKMLRE